MRYPDTPDTACAGQVCVRDRLPLQLPKRDINYLLKKIKK